MRLRPEQKRSKPIETMPERRQQAQERDQRRGGASLQRPCQREGSKREIETRAEAEQAYRDHAGEEAAGVRAKPAQRHGKLTETMAKRRQQARERDQHRVRARLQRSRCQIGGSRRESETSAEAGQAFRDGPTRRQQKKQPRSFKEERREREGGSRRIEVRGEN